MDIIPILFAELDTRTQDFIFIYYDFLSDTELVMVECSYSHIWYRLSLEHKELLISICNDDTNKIMFNMKNDNRVISNACRYKSGMDFI